MRSPPTGRARRGGAPNPRRTTGARRASSRQSPTRVGSGSRDCSTTRLLTTTTTCQATQARSQVPTASGSGSSPNGRPRVRVTAQSAMTSEVADQADEQQRSGGVRGDGAGPDQLGERARGEEEAEQRGLLEVLGCHRGVHPGGCGGADDRQREPSPLRGRQHRHTGQPRLLGGHPGGVVGGGRQVVRGQTGVGQAGPEGEHALLVLVAGRVRGGEEAGCQQRDQTHARRPRRWRSGSRARRGRGRRARAARAWWGSLLPSPRGARLRRDEADSRSARSRRTGAPSDCWQFVEMCAEIQT